MKPASFSGPPWWFSTDFITRLERVIFRGLKHLSEEQRADRFQDALQSATDITLLCDAFRAIAGDVTSEGATTHRSSEITFGARTEGLREQLVQKLRQLAQSGLLWEQAEPERLLWFWWGAGYEQEVIQFTQQAMEDPIAVRVLLHGSVNLVRSTAGNYERVPNYLRKILNVERLEEIAHQLVKHDVSSVEGQLADRFLKALERGNRERD